MLFLLNWTILHFREWPQRIATKTKYQFVLLNGSHLRWLFCYGAINELRLKEHILICESGEIKDTIGICWCCSIRRVDQWMIVVRPAREWEAPARIGFGVEETAQLIAIYLEVFEDIHLPIHKEGVLLRKWIRCWIWKADREPKFRILIVVQEGFGNIEGYLFTLA